MVTGWSHFYESREKCDGGQQETLAVITNAASRRADEVTISQPAVTRAGHGYSPYGTRSWARLLSIVNRAVAIIDIARLGLVSSTGKRFVSSYAVPVDRLSSPSLKAHQTIYIRGETSLERRGRHVPVLFNCEASMKAASADVESSCCY